MTTPTWPKYLPYANATRTETQGWVTTAVNAGPGYYELVTDDVGSTYDVTWKFSRDQARAFREWQKINRFQIIGGYFYLPIKLEEGITTQLVRIIDDGIQPSGSDGMVYTYKATVFCREENASDDDFPEAILAMFENNCGQVSKGGNLLDIAINISWPEA